MKTIEQLEEEITQLNKKTNRLRQDLEALKAQPEQLTGRVLDEKYEGRCFSLLRSSGESWECNGEPERIRQGYMFHDLETAVRFSLFERLQQRERVAAAKAWEDAGEVIDWGDLYQYKYRAFLNIHTGRVEAYGQRHTKASRPHFPSRESLLAFYDTLSSDEQKLLCTGVE